jgi:RNA polymerase sigma factor (sigma-70 family)
VGKKRSRSSKEPQIELFTLKDQIGLEFASSHGAGLPAEVDMKEKARSRRHEESDSDASAPSMPLLPIYLKETGSVPLLTKEGESELAKDLQEARRACAKLMLKLPPDCRKYVLNGNAQGPKRGSKWPLQQLEDSYDRLLKYLGEQSPAKRNGNKIAIEIKKEKRRLDRARDSLITANLRLVTHIAKQYGNQGIPFMDLIQEGNIGLMRAVEKFEYKRGFKFSTYAYWWIKQAITRAIADKSRLIRIPVHVGDRLKKIQKISRALADSLGRDPTPAEIAEQMKMPVKKIKELLGAEIEP